MSAMEDFFKAEKIKPSAQELSRSNKAIPEGDIDRRKYRNYYDRNSTITVAQATNPNDPDANTVVAGAVTPIYNQERVFELLERNAERIFVSNDGSDTLFVIAAHMGGQSFSAERPIYPGENKEYFNIYELRLRSATAGVPYRVTEYPICCNNTSGASSRGSPSQAVININSSGDNTIIAAPGVGKRIKIVNLFMVASAAVSVTLKSGAATNLTGAMAFAANSGMGFNGDFNPLQMAINQAFVINLSGNVQVSGFVLYYAE